MDDQDVTICSSSSDEIELSSDGKWLKEHFQLPLKMAIKELLLKKPYDPIKYLGFWLLHYKNCLEYNQWRLEKDEELKHLRALLYKPPSSVEKGDTASDGEEEETKDLNFQHYDNAFN